MKIVSFGALLALALLACGPAAPAESKTPPPITPAPERVETVTIAPAPTTEAAPPAMPASTAVAAPSAPPVDRPLVTSVKRAPGSVGVAGEATFVTLDAEIRAAFDFDTGHHKFSGPVDQFTGQAKDGALDRTGSTWHAAAREAEKWDVKLDALVQSPSTAPAVVASALARKGSLYDGLRAALLLLVPPKLVLFTPKETEMLDRLAASGRPDLEAKAAEIRAKKLEFWNAWRAKEMAALEETAVRSYAKSIALARKSNVTTPWTAFAVQALAHLRTVVGEARMKAMLPQESTDPK